MLEETIQFRDEQFHGPEVSVKSLFAEMRGPATSELILEGVNRYDMPQHGARLRNACCTNRRMEDYSRREQLGCCIPLEGVSHWIYTDVLNEVVSAISSINRGVLRQASRMMRYDFGANSHWIPCLD